MRNISTLAIVFATTVISSTSYAGEPIDCETIKELSKGCHVCFDNGEVRVGEVFKPFMEFTAENAKGFWYFDDENKIVYEFKTLSPKQTVWATSNNLLQYPDDFVWDNLVSNKKYEGRKVHFFRPSQTTRIFETQDNKGVKLIEVKDELTNEYDYRMKFKMKYRSQKSEDELGKKRKKYTCAFYKAVDEIYKSDSLAE